MYVYREPTGLYILPKGLQYFVYRRNFNWPHGCVYRVQLYYNLREGDRGFWLCDVTSLVMYCIDVPQRIVTKSLYRTALPFSLLNSAITNYRIGSSLKRWTSCTNEDLTIYWPMILMCPCINYLCTYDLYGPVRKVFDAGRYFTWGSGGGRVALDLEFCGPLWNCTSR